MKKQAAALFLLPLLLSSCGKATFAPEDYVQKLPLFATKDTVNVLQITDLHWSLGVDVSRQKDYLSSLFASSNPDLVVTSGDNVMIGNEGTVRSFVATMDELAEIHGFSWITTFGNHDRQGIYEPGFWKRVLASSSHCLYSELDDDLTGRSNYVLSLTDASGTPLWNVVSIDSNSYFQSSTLAYSYDIVHEDQIKWYEEVSSATGDVPNLVYIHIPLYEVEYAFRLAGQKGGTLEDGTGRPDVEAPGILGRFSGVMHEADVVKNDELGPSRCCVGFEPSRLFSALEAHHGRGVFFGHDHINDFIAEYKTSETGEYVTIGYGLKTGDGLYFEDGMIGGTLSTIHRDGSVSYSRCFHGYEADSFRKEDLFA